MEPGSTPRPLVQKQNWRDSLRIDMLLSAVSVLVVAQSSSEIPEGLMNNPVFLCPGAPVCLGPALQWTVIVMTSVLLMLFSQSISRTSVFVPQHVGGHGCLSVVIVVCCQVEVSATN